MQNPAAPLKMLYRASSSKRRRQFLLVLALTLAGAIAEMLTIGATLPLLALVLTPRRVPAGVTSFLDRLTDLPVVSASILLVSAAIAAAGVRLLLLSQSQKLVAGLGHEMTLRMFGRMLRQPYEHYVQRNSSEMLSGIEKVQAVVISIFQPAMQGLTSAIMAVLISFLLFLIEPRVAGLVVAGLVLAYWGVGAVTRGKLHSNSRIVAQERTERIKIVQESLGGIRDIILSRAQPLLEAKLERVDRRFRDAQTRSFVASAAPRFVIEAVIISAIALGAALLDMRGTGIRQTLPVLGALAFGAHRLLPLLQQAYAGWSRTAGNIQLLNDVVDLMNRPVRDEGIPPSVMTIPFRGTIVFDRVSYRHSGRSFGIDDVSFRIRRGARIGVSGPTGSGKSTLMDLLMGLLEPTSGQIRIDDHILDSGSWEAWQTQIAHVPQAIFLADNTIAANVAFGQGKLDEGRLAASIQAAQLTDFIASLPDGVQTVVGERGLRLSGGQRQRIGIARALYKGAPILILDEATSALDAGTEDAILDAIFALADVTVIIISHQPGLLDRCQQILQMEGGRMVRAGPKMRIRSGSEL